MKSDRKQNVLGRIIAVKEKEVAALLHQRPSAILRDCQKGAPETRGFIERLRTIGRQTGKPALIAEVKKASPSKGVIREDFDPVLIARQYESGGAACLSVLTDQQFFQGSLEYLKAIKEAVSLPILRKDFIIDTVQVYESREAGADAILLIAACLDATMLFELHRAAGECSMDVLVEIHDDEDWQKVLSSGISPELIGINNRDLRTFETSLETFERLAPHAGATGSVLVAESGIFTPDDVSRVQVAGAGAVLVGESLMRQPDPEQAVKELLR